MRILITGSREWTDRSVIRSALTGMWSRTAFPEVPVVVHGAARGADTIAAQEADLLGWATEAHPVTSAQWRSIGPSAGHRRNAEMVSAGADVCLAFPLGESRGTRGCMRLAARAGIEVISFEPRT